MKTFLVNLWASPSCGKSTLAAGVFHDLKTRGVNAELITEHAKTYAWEGRKISSTDQIRLMAEQSIAEERLIGKVDVAITDSPSLLGAFYDQYYGETKSITFDFLAELRRRRAHRVYEIDLLLPRRKFYDERGRYQTKEEAAKVHDTLVLWLVKNEVDVLPLEAASVGAVRDLLKSHGLCI